MTLKIAEIICPVEYGGGENQIELRSVELKKRGVDVTIICLAKSEALESSLIKYGIRYISITNRKLGFSPSFKDYISHTIFIFPKILKNLKNFYGYDILNAHSFPAILVPFMLSYLNRNKFKGKFIYTHHHYPRAKFFKYFKNIEEFMLKKYHAIITVSSKVKAESIEKFFPNLKNKTLVIPNGIDENEFKVNYDKINLRRTLGISLNDIIAIYPARFAPHKNHKFLLKVLKVINLENFKLIVTSSGSEVKNFKDEARDMGVLNRIIFTGNISHDLLVRYLYASDICLFPSTAEGFGVGILEAMRAGLPTVIFRKIYMEEHGNDILVSDNEEEFINLTKLLVFDERFRKELSEKVKKHARNFTIDKITEKYLCFCREIVSK